MYAVTYISKFFEKPKPKSWLSDFFAYWMFFVVLLVASASLLVWHSGQAKRKKMASKLKAIMDSAWNVVVAAASAVNAAPVFRAVGPAVRTAVGRVARKAVGTAVGPAVSSTNVVANADKSSADAKDNREDETEMIKERKKISKQRKRKDKNILRSRKSFILDDKHVEVSVKAKKLDEKESKAKIEKGQSSASRLLKKGYVPYLLIPVDELEGISGEGMLKTIVVYKKFKTAPVHVEPTPSINMERKRAKTDKAQQQMHEIPNDQCKIKENGAEGDSAKHADAHMEPKKAKNTRIMAKAVQSFPYVPARNGAFSTKKQFKYSPVSSAATKIPIPPVPKHPYSDRKHYPIRS